MTAHLLAAGVTPIPFPGLAYHAVLPIFIVLGAALFGLIVGIFWVLAADELTRLSNTPSGMIGLESLKKSFTSQKKHLV